MNPRILLVEDDPTSRAFLQAATERLPARVDAAGDIAGAVALAQRHAYALWLFDARLPDGTGRELLARLRDEGLATPALAHTASHDPREHEALLDAGFVATVAKPLSAERWLQLLRTTLEEASGQMPADTDAASSSGRVDDVGRKPVWDEAAALAALGGNADNVAALRRLFLDELPGVRDAIVRAAAAGDIEGVRATLHRLRASCGFVGATRLDAATSILREAPLSQAILQAFLDAAQDTLSSP